MFFYLPIEIRNIIWTKAKHEYYKEIYSKVLNEMRTTYFYINSLQKITWDDYFNNIFTNNRISVGGMPFAMLYHKKAKKSKYTCNR